jgi:DNA repair exonuclease SbcCD ATPase subunit
MTKVLDNLQRNQEQLNEIAALKDKLENNKINYNKAQSRLSKALNEIELIKGIAIENKELKRIISRRNEALKRRDVRITNLENSIHDLKGNYGVK